MREHPIPQDITSYRFHIIGNMTLKQFAILGLGCLVGALFYASNLMAIVKWPLVIMSFGLGAIVAFVPYEERPMDYWIITFFKILYKPTKFFWKREPTIPESFKYVKPELQLGLDEDADLTSARRQRILEYLDSVKRQTALDFDPDEANRINSILVAFEQVEVVSTSATTLISKPRLGVRIRGLSSLVSTVIDEEASDGELIGDRKRSAFSHKQVLSTEQVAQEIEVKQTKDVSVDSQLQEADQELINAPNLSREDRSFATIQQAAKTPKPTQRAATNVRLPFPSKPKKANKIVGMILTPNNKLVTSAVVEIKTLEGKIVRAVKTNPLGQFFVTTPLKDGEYVIDIEKDGFGFPTIQITLEGKIIDPIEIRSNA